MPASEFNDGSPSMLFDKRRTHYDRLGNTSGTKSIDISDMNAKDTYGSFDIRFPKTIPNPKSTSSISIEIQT